MRILFVALEIQSRIGGIARFNQRVVRCLEEETGSSIESASAISLWDSSTDPNSRETGVLLVGCEQSKLKFATRFLYHVIKERPRIILYGHVLLWPFAVAARLLNPRCHNVLFVHGIEVWSSPNPVRRWFTRHLFSRVTSVSRLTATRMKEHYDLAQKRISILPPGVDVGDGEDKAMPTRATTHTDSQGRILTIGRLSRADRDKGIDFLIRAMPLVQEDCPNSLLTIVGEGSLRGPLEDLAIGLGIKDSVQFLGKVDDEELERNFQTHELFVLPSRKEGFGIVFLEAWRHRLPVIAGNQDASTEVIEHGRTGLLVDPQNPREIAEAIVRLLTDQEARRRMGEAGYELVCRRYSHDNFRSGLRALLTSCTEHAGVVQT